MKTRFAPSPTGDLHLGGAWTALAAWAHGRAHDGQTVLRVEDIDTPRVVAGSAARILDDLAWLGFDWDVTTPPQSAEVPRYEAYVATLASRGQVYPCDCSRAEIVRVASAPHAGEELRYPGTCRDKDPAREMKRDPALRFRVPPKKVVFEDLVRGRVEQHVHEVVGDFVLRRGDGVFAYQLAASVDDARDATHVIRADDLLASTARQILLLEELGLAVPTYAHVPLVVAPTGERVAKRVREATIRALRERGVAAETIIGVLAHALGLVDTPTPRTPREVATHLRPIAEWRRVPWPVPPALM